MDPSQDCADLNKSSGGSTTALAGVLKDTVVADFNLEEKQTHLLQKIGDITIDKLQISVLKRQIALLSDPSPIIGNACQ